MEQVVPHEGPGHGPQWHVLRKCHKAALLIALVVVSGCLRTSTWTANVSLPRPGLLLPGRLSAYRAEDRFLHGQRPWFATRLAQLMNVPRPVGSRAALVSLSGLALSSLRARGQSLPMMMSAAPFTVHPGAHSVHAGLLAIGMVVPTLLLLPWVYRRRMLLYSLSIPAGQTFEDAELMKPLEGEHLDSGFHFRPVTTNDLAVLQKVLNSTAVGDRARASKSPMWWDCERWMAAGHSYLLARDAGKGIVSAAPVKWVNNICTVTAGPSMAKSSTLTKGAGEALVNATERWAEERSNGRPHTVQMAVLDPRCPVSAACERLGYISSPGAKCHAVLNGFDLDSAKVEVFQKTFGGAASAGADAPLPTPVPWLRVLTVGLVLFVNHFSLMLVLPFTPFMVADFFPDLPKAQLGLKVGYLSSSFFLGQFAGAYIWGVAADRYGRRPVLLLGMLGTVLSMGMFGLSTTFPQALAARFLGGFLNGNTGVCKVYLSEILDFSNAATGFAVIGMQAAIGRLLGPSLGGLLSRPTRKLPMFAGVQLFHQYPYLLPCMVATLVGLAGIAMALLYLPETLQRGTKQNPEVVESSGPEPQPEPRPTVRTRAVLVSLLMYMGLSFAHIGFEQLFPLWLLKDRAQGGFNFDEGMIGAVIAMTGPVQLVSQVTAVPALVRKVSYRKAWQIVIMMFGIAVALTPFAALATSCHSMWAWWAAAVGAYMVVNVPAEAAYTYTSILVNDSVDKVNRGKVNGLGQSLVSATRMVGPVAWGVLFAHTAAYWQVSFYLICLILICSVMLASRLPRHVGAPH